MVRVALIEDNASLREVLRECLELEGYTVSAYEDDEVAAQVLQQDGCHIIVTDHIADDFAQLSLDGRARLERLSRLAPTIVYTARPWAYSATSDDLGVAALVPKFAGLGDLIAAIQQAADGLERAGR